jgi:hypothetical protein
VARPPAESTITTRQLNRATLARQMLLAREKAAASKAIARLLAIQAQLARPPFVGLWARLDGFRRDDLIGALDRREVVRATSMRGTIHLMTAADFAALRGAIQPGLTRVMTSMLRNRLAGADADRAMALAREFFGATPATFDSFRTRLQRNYPKADIRAMAYAVRMQLPLVQVPTGAAWGFAAAADFALADDWLGAPVATEAAPPATLVTRYLAAHGPATIADAQWWTGLANLRPVFDALRPSLVVYRDERQRELFDLPKAPRPDADTPAPARLLPEFDAVMLAHQDRGRFLADAHRPRVASKNLQVPAVFLVDGMVAGTWKIERKGKVAALALQPFGALAKKTLEALEAEGEALARFVEPDAGK